MSERVTGDRPVPDLTPLHVAYNRALRDFQRYPTPDHKRALDDARTALCVAAASHGQVTAL